MTRQCRQQTRPPTDRRHRAINQPTNNRGAAEQAFFHGGGRDFGIEAVFPKSCWVTFVGCYLSLYETDKIDVNKTCLFLSPKRKKICCGWSLVRRRLFLS